MTWKMPWRPMFTRSLEARSSTSRLETTIPRSVRLGEAPSFGKPILTYDIRSKGAEAYLELAREVMGHEATRAGEGPVGPDSGA